MNCVKISPHTSRFSIGLSEIFQYKDLIILLAKRDLAAVYKQTILGPLWYFIQPALTTLMFTFIFGIVARIETGGIPHILFYLSGVTLWSFFSTTANRSAESYTVNRAIFEKVYFPRFVIPISFIISGLFKLGIQFLLLGIVWSFYKFSRNTEITLNFTLFLLPIYVLILGLFAIGLGCLVSALSAKYRDLKHVFGFGLQLLMYATPIIYPISLVPQRFLQIYKLNPIVHVIEAMKYSILGAGEFSSFGLIYSFIISIVFFYFGALMFHKMEKQFIDEG